MTVWEEESNEPGTD